LIFIFDFSFGSFFRSTGSRSDRRFPWSIRNRRP